MESALSRHSIAEEEATISAAAAMEGIEKSTKEYRMQSAPSIPQPVSTEPIQSVVYILPGPSQLPAPKPQEQNYSRRVRSEQNAMWWPQQQFLNGRRRSIYTVDNDASDEEVFVSGRSGTTLRSSTAAATSTAAANPIGTDGRPGDNEIRQPKLARPTNHTYPNPQQIQAIRERDELLIAIRLELEVNGNRIRDCLTWNINEPVQTPEKFGEIYCHDLGLPLGYAPLIAESIRSQIKEFMKFISAGIALTEGYVPIKIDLQAGRTRFTDQFIWDLSSPLTPEQFSNSLCGDLGLGGEFPVLIAHSIRYKLQRHLMDYGADGLLDPLEAGSAFRMGERAQQWVPAVEELTEEELEQFLKQQERDARRMRRESTKFSSRSRY